VKQRIEKENNLGQELGSICW